MKTAVDTVLKKVKKLSDPRKVIRAFLDEAGLSVERSARALYRSPECGHLNLSANGVARVLYGEDGLHLDAYDVAKVLCSRSGLDLSEYDTALVLYSEDGLNLDEYEVARILRRLGLSTEQIANLLCYGLGIPKTCVVRVLVSPSGLGLSDEEVRQVLRSKEGFHLSAGKAAELLAAKELEKDLVAAI